MYWKNFKLLRRNSSTPIPTIFLLIFVCHLEKMQGAEVQVNTLPGFKGNKAVLGIKVKFPESMDFFLNKKMPREKNQILGTPFVFKSFDVINTRYSATDFSFVNIILLAYIRPFQPSDYQWDNNKFQEFDVELLESHPKRFQTLFNGSKPKHIGHIYKIREYINAKNDQIYKWIAVFGNSIQSNIVIAAYPRRLDEKYGEEFQRVVEFSGVKAPNSQR